MTSLARLVALPLCLQLAGCASFYLGRAPRSPREAWKLPDEPARPVHAPPETPAIASDRIYTLPELIDLAEATNPDTRIGWERARQAALGVGIANADWFPLLTAFTLAGYQHVWFPVPTLSQSTVGVNPFEVLPNVSFPVPKLAQPSGSIGIDTFQVLPFLSIRWPLLDLGRGPAVKAAESLSIASNALFTAAHQKIIFDVASAYFRLSAARSQIAVNKDALERTRTVAKAAEARYAQGIATVVELSEARREVAQAEYNLAEAEAGEIAVYSALVVAMGIDPAVHLEVAENPSRELPSRVDGKLEDYVKSALRSRPDLRAARARLPSTEAEVSRSLAAYAPRVNLTGTAGAAVLGADIDGLGMKTLTLPNVTAGVSIDWVIFDGGLRELRGEIARSKHSEAYQELVKLEHQTVQEVIKAYSEMNATLSRYQAASALLGSATIAEDAVTKSYLNGLATLTDAMNAQKARALASAEKEQAFADALVAAAALTFASGELTSARAVPHAAE
jgi:outer membrane protein TolC